MVRQPICEGCGDSDEGREMPELCLKCRDFTID